MITKTVSELDWTTSV